MMTESLQVSILAAPLGAIDRRALSQAWYSALRVVEGSVALPAPQRRTAGAGASARTFAPPGGCARDARASASEVPGNARGCRGSRAPFAAPPAACARRRPPLSVQIERRFAGAKPAVKRATFTVGRGEARVHVILQTTGNRATLLALCRPEMQPAVARALMQARLALAQRGVALDLPEKRGVSCS